MKKVKCTQSFTIIELAVVIVIIMIILSLVVGAGRKARLTAVETKAKSMIAALEVAISMYHVETEGYPDDTSLATMISALKTDPGGSVTGWHGPYMEFNRNDYQDKNPTTNVIVDPWGSPYKYDVSPSWGNTNSYNLWSIGPDKIDQSSDGDTDYGDDIYNW